MLIVNKERVYMWKPDTLCQVICGLFILSGVDLGYIVPKQFKLRRCSAAAHYIPTRWRRQLL